MTSAPRYDVDAIATVQEYLDRSDWRVNANANQGYSLGGLVLNSAGKIVAKEVQALYQTLCQPRAR